MKTERKCAVVPYRNTNAEHPTQKERIISFSHILSSGSYIYISVMAVKIARKVSTFVTHTAIRKSHYM